jgi:N-acyl-D-aspartate/D-glutamate deacylase
MFLIKNGKIIDGTGRLAYKADILISNDKISAIENSIQKSGIETLDALGMAITPGFIDPNTDSDHYLTLFTNSEQEDFLLQGVTTIIGGHCGASLVPLLYGSLESIRKWADTTQINVSWHTVGEFLHILENRRLGVNFGTLVGHSTIRRALIGEAQRDLTENELVVFGSIVEKALQEGALGFSTGLGYAHSALVPMSEIEPLLKIVSRYGGIYTAHLRNEEKNILSAIQETINVARAAKVKTIISHLRPLLGFENYIKQAREALKNLESGLDLHFDTFPFDASFVPIYTLLPDWAKKGNLESMWGVLTRAATRDEVKKDLVNLPLDKMLIASAPSNKYLVGKTVADFSKNQNISYSEGLLELMVLTRMKAVLLYKNINLGLAEEMIFDERALVGTNGASLSRDEYAISPERSLKTFPRFLELALKQKDYPFESAIKKITSQIAKKLGLKNRGVIKEGYAADLTILDGSKVTHVFVNGSLSVRDGKLLKAGSGQIIKRA